MSVKLMSAVWESDLPPTERFVMMSLADHADDMGRQCYPSIARISRRTGYGERAVQGALKRLQERGFLVVEKNAGQGNANLYTITLTPAADAPPQQMHPRSRCTPPPQEMRVTPAADAPKPSITTIEPSEDTPLTPQAILEAVASKNAVTSFLAYRKRRRAPFTETAAKRLASSLRAIAQSGGDPDDALGMAEERNWQTVKPDWYAREKQEKSNGRNGSAADLARRAGERFAARYVDSRQGAGASQPLLSAGQSGGSAGGGS